MPCIQYQHKRFRADSLARIAKANDIIAEYQEQGFDLTLRQLYYQFVSRDLIPNNQKSYDNLGALISDARLAGLIDWNTIQDRTRNLQSNSHWDSPDDIVDACSRQYRVDLWENQPYRPEVWIEKDALIGVIEGVCTELDVPYFSCRGYTSQSEMWRAGQRLLKYGRNKQIPIIFHFGDHDPSGIDMTRDIRDRLEMFTGGEVRIERQALNMDQIEEFDPPPNFAKITDSRADAYIAEFGEESWELDALEPAEIVSLIRRAVTNVRDEKAWQKAVDRQTKGRDDLELVSSNWNTALSAVTA